MADRSITRRDFVQYLGLGIATLWLPPVPEWLRERNAYVSDDFGFRLTKPRDWRWVSAQEMESARDKAAVPGGEEAKRVIAPGSHRCVNIISPAALMPHNTSRPPLGVCPSQNSGFQSEFHHLL